MHYFGDLKERFGGWPLALAAFNAGYGAVLRSMQKYNTNDYWELCRHEDGLPWETTLYVPKAMAVADRRREPAALRLRRRRRRPAVRLRPRDGAVVDEPGRRSRTPPASPSPS